MNKLKLDRNRRNNEVTDFLNQLKNLKPINKFNDKPQKETKQDGSKLINKSSIGKEEGSIPADKKNRPSMDFNFDDFKFLNQRLKSGEFKTKKIKLLQEIVLSEEPLILIEDL